MIVSARGDDPYESAEALWRRASVPAAAIEKLADADAFHSLAQDRRQALWRAKGLGEAPLPMFAAAGAREDHLTPEREEPMVALEPLGDGREVVEDYRTIQLSLRAHPLHFLREDLKRCGIKTAAQLDQIKDGRHVEVAGIILVREKPGSAKGGLFITIEDETGVANGTLWPDRFEAQRRTVLSAAMVGLEGRLQREGLVTHIIIDKVIDYTPLLCAIGDREFPFRAGPGDGATHGGGPDARERTQERGKIAASALRINSRDFH